jgi:tetratricopeptide (TPR) repeat protein
VIKRSLNLLPHCICLVLLILLTPMSTQSSVKLRVEIWANKMEYLPREPIMVYYAIENVGDQAVDVNRYSVEGCFRIEDEQGVQYPIGILAVCLAFAPKPLKPNDKLEGCRGLDGFLEPGKYIVYLRCPNWTDEIVTKSNKLELIVKEPEGEEKEALKMFIEAGTVESAEKENQGRCPKRGLAEFLKYQEVVERYPNSVYAPLALRAAVSIYFYSQNLEERRQVIPLFLKLIENYPDFYDFQGTISGLVGTYEILKDKEGAITTMQEFIEEHPNTKISERAEYWLKKIEEWEFE